MLGYSAQEVAYGREFPMIFCGREDPHPGVQSELERAAEDICAKGAAFLWVPSPRKGAPIWVQGDQAGHFGGRVTVWVQCADGYHRPP